MDKKPPPFLGHEAIARSLAETLAKGRLPHAMLFTGPEGVGKLKLARHLATAMLCQGIKPPCGACASCKLVEEDKHPDFMLIQPENGSIKIDTIRELVRGFSFAPLVGKARVVLMDDAHTLNTAAANALLKTLEEPPAATYFLLITHALGWLPRTITSRCQKVRFGPLNQEALKTIFQGLEQQTSSELLQASQGSAGRALRLETVEAELPSLTELLPSGQGWGFNQAYARTLAVVEAEKVEPFLEGLLVEAHRWLTRQNRPKEWDFPILCFTDKILEIRKSLRLNANPKLALTRLLMYFREPMQSRL